MGEMHVVDDQHCECTPIRKRQDCERHAAEAKTWSAMCQAMKRGDKQYVHDAFMATHPHHVIVDDDMSVNVRWVSPSDQSEQDIRLAGLLGNVVLHFPGAWLRDANSYIWWSDEEKATYPLSSEMDNLS